MRIGDLLLASSKDEKLSERYGGGAIQTILKTALESKLVGRVVSFQEKKDRFDLVPMVAEEQCQLDPLPLSQFSAYYLSGVNSVPKYIQQNLKGAGRIAVIAKPCDVRAIVELAKKRQISLEDLVIVGEECRGKVSPKEIKKILEEDQLDSSRVSGERVDLIKLKILVDGENKSYILGEDVDLMESCKRCTERVPPVSDISFQITEDNGGTRTLIHINTERGLKLVEAASSKLSLEEAGNELLDSLRSEMDLQIERAKEYRAEQFRRFEGESEAERYANFKSMFENCRKCGMCIRACPLCVCVDCTVVRRRKEIDPVFYNLLRMGHMGESCVNCGKCDSVCNFLDPGPSLVFHRLSELSRAALNYNPGKDVNEPLPRSRKRQM
ncbi:MAG: Coenzyme F420 hydrogenase/dehydrogenase, beta subunit C-terminal domain [Candidatus Freyarchaeota archaeon]